MAEGKHGFVTTMNIIQKVKRAIIQERAFFLTMPALIWHGLFFLLPLFLIIFMSLVTIDPVTQAVHSTLKYYGAVLNFIHAKIIISSLLLALFTATHCLLIGYPIAYYLALHAKHKNLFLFFLIIPFFSNILILIYAWFFILGKEGLISTGLVLFNIINQPISFLNNIFSIALVMIYCYLPFMILPILSILEKLDICLIEASFDLGATYRQTFFKVILPLSWPGIKTGFFLVFIMSFGELIIPLLMGGDKYLFVGNTISHYVFNAFDLATGTAFTIMSSIVAAISLYITAQLLKRIITST